MGLVWFTCLSVILSQSRTRTKPGLSQDSARTQLLLMDHIIWYHVCATLGPAVFSAIWPKLCISKTFPSISKFWRAIRGQGVVQMLVCSATFQPKILAVRVDVKEIILSMCYFIWHKKVSIFIRGIYIVFHSIIIVTGAQYNKTVTT